MAAAVADVSMPDVDDAVSPRQNAPPIEQAIQNVANPLGPLDLPPTPMRKQP